MKEIYFVNQIEAEIERKFRSCISPDDAFIKSIKYLAEYELSEKDDHTLISFLVKLYMDY